MSFRLVPKSVTLNDLELRNWPYGCLISPNSVAVSLSSVTFVHPTQAIEIFSNVSMPFNTLVI